MPPRVPNTLCLAFAGLATAATGESTHVDCTHGGLVDHVTTAFVADTCAQVEQTLRVESSGPTRLGIGIETPSRHMVQVSPTMTLTVDGRTASAELEHPILLIVQDGVLDQVFVAQFATAIVNELRRALQEATTD